MKSLVLYSFSILVATLPNSASSSLSPEVRSVIPAGVQQIVCIDGLAIKGGGSALTEPLFATMKRFEDAAKDLGADTTSDLDRFTLASFLTSDHGLAVIGVAQGRTLSREIGMRLSSRRIASKKVHERIVYALAHDLSFSFLDDERVLFGSDSAVQAALKVHSHPSENLNANRELSNMIASVERSTVWSVLDASGTQEMTKLLLGAASNLSEYEDIKKRLLGARYTADFDSGVDFNLLILTSDNITAATLSTMLKAGILFKKLSALPVERLALNNTSVDSDDGRVIIRVKIDEKTFQQLLESPDFVAATAKILGL